MDTSNRQQELIDAITSISLSMFRKNFFGIFHGSISARITQNRFIINKQQAVFDNINKDSMIMLYHKQDYRWNEASLHAPIHANIYKNFSEAKFIAYAMPPYAISYSLKFAELAPKDYFGYKVLGKNIKIFDLKDYDSWAVRAETDIPRYFKDNNTSFIIIKGYGIYAFSRDIYQLAKTISIIENSCKILHHNAELGKVFAEGNQYDV